jgi:hypothetical protein
MWGETLKRMFVVENRFVGDETPPSTLWGCRGLSKRRGIREQTTGRRGGGKSGRPCRGSRARLGPRDENGPAAGLAPLVPPGGRPCALRAADRSSPFSPVQFASGRGASPGAPVPGTDLQRHQGMVQAEGLPQGPALVLCELTKLLLAPTLTHADQDREDPLD